MTSAIIFNFVEFQYGDDAEAYLLRLSNSPSVRSVVGQLEMCPETKKLHVQGTLTLFKDRSLKFMKKFTQTAHWVMVRKDNGCVRYACK